MNRRTGCAQFAAERIMIAELAVVRLGVRIGRRADILEIRFRKWRFVWRAVDAPSWSRKR